MSYNKIDLEDFMSFKSQCNTCNRKSGKEDLGKLCKMPQPNKSICPGKFIPYEENNNHDQNLPWTY